MIFPLWLQAGFWGLVSGSALLLGAAIGYFAPVSQRAIAAVMAFGAGVLISAVSFELMDEAYQRGGFDSTAIGFLGGAVLYTAAKWLLDVATLDLHEQSGKQEQSESKKSGVSRGEGESEDEDDEEDDDSGLAIALGALIDGIPESIAIGVSMIDGGAVSYVTVAAIFLSNIPEGLASAASMKKTGSSAVFILGMWGSIVVVEGVAALAGYAVFSHLGEEIIAATTAVAAGGILAMISDTMMPQAYAKAHDFAGLITTLGFLAAKVLSKLGG